MQSNDSNATMNTWYNSGHKSAAAMLETSSGMARISQRLRRTESDMQDDNTPTISPTSKGRWPVPATRFWDHVNKTDYCWLWTGSFSGFGYGAFRVFPPHVSKPIYNAHVYSWEIHYGAIPKGLCVLHRCDNPPCVNPAHLFLGTKETNNIDMSIKERATIKLSNAEVREAREIHASGRLGYRRLAKQYGVSRSNMKDIIKRVRRAHVQ